MSKFCRIKNRSTPSVELLNLDVFVIDVVPIHVHRLRLVTLVIRDDCQTVVRAVEADLHRLPRQDLLREDHDAQWVEQLCLDRTVQRTSTVCWRVANGHEVVLGLVIDHQLDLAVIQPLL